MIMGLWMAHPLVILDLLVRYWSLVRTTLITKAGTFSNKWLFYHQNSNVSADPIEVVKTSTKFRNFNRLEEEKKSLIPETFFVLKYWLCFSEKRDRDRNTSTMEVLQDGSERDKTPPPSSSSSSSPIPVVTNFWKGLFHIHVYLSIRLLRVTRSWGWACFCSQGKFVFRFILDSAEVVSLNQIRDVMRFSLDVRDIALVV